jgi:hypothetical protein
MSYFLSGIPKLALGHHKKKHFGATKLLPKKNLNLFFLKEKSLYEIY